MNFEAKGSPPAFSRLDEVLQDFNKERSVSRFKRPSKKVKVKKRGSFGLGKLFSSEKKKPVPNCEKEGFVEISGELSRRATINCEGCRFSSDLSDPECRMRCARIAGKKSPSALVLDDGFYKKEYGEEDIGKLKEVYSISNGLQIAYPKECGLCAVEHDKQVETLKKAILKNPEKLLNGGVEMTDNEEITVKGVEREICEECKNRTVEAVEKSLSKLRKTKLAQGSSFSPLVRPFFSNSRVLFKIPEKNNIEECYETNHSKVIISKGREEVYSIFPPEYSLGKQELEVLKGTYSEILKEKDKDEKSFKDFCKEKINKIASKKGFGIDEERQKQMSEDLVRCTRGLDIIELMLKDPNLQDVYINSPIDSTPLYVKHSEYDDCRTNVYLSEQAARNIISKFRLRSGRAFSEVSPILDMELPEFGVRVNITGPPVSPDGLAFAFRRASEEPWTLLRFIENRMLSPLAAGLLSMMVNEESTILMAGDRGSGKTSLLSALIGAMPTKYRILTMEDTFEIPVPTLAKKGGFRIQRMRIKPPTSGDSHEMSADGAMRSLLRMGDSAIVMGEVRGREARTLYEAMNVGGSGNCVLGTIHGKSPRSLLERVVSSLGVPPQSFKATDLVVVADRIRPGGGSRRLRRVAKIVEVGKRWSEPNESEVFQTLMEYDQESDLTVSANSLRNPEKSEIICKIARKRGVTPREVLEDAQTRAAAYEHMVGLARETGDKKLLGLKSMVGINQKYLQLVDESIRDFGKTDYGFVLDGITQWIDNNAGSGAIEIVTKDGLREIMQGDRPSL